ncbi:MAG: hypothetical protein RJA05_913 [Planctomycetota bacterium]|jgi:hypothetical protein
MSEPIIVIGAARSGTKWVRSLLASTGTFRVVPYDVNYIWRSGQHALPHDVLSPEVDGQQISKIRSLLDRVALPSPQGPGQPMLEKTVSNALRVPFVRRVFPEARFVEIVRDGREAIASTFEQWGRPMERWYGLQKVLAVPPACWPYLIQLGLRRTGVARTSRSWGVRYEGIDDDLLRRTLPEVCAMQWASCIRGGRNLLGLPESTFIRIRYEELCRSERRVRDLATWAGLPERAVVDAWKRETVIPDRRYERTFDGAARERIEALVGSELAECSEQ